HNRRICAVSSFGIGGTNAHVIVSEHRAHMTHFQAAPQLIILSAKTPESLEIAKSQLADYLAHHPELRLQDVAYTLQTGRPNYHYKFATICSSIADATRQLMAGLADASHESAEYQSDLL